MAYTQSGMERRKNISDMAQALSGAKMQRAGLETERRQGKRNRTAALLGKGIDFAGGMAKQKLAGEQELEQIGARGEEERLGLQEQYAPASTFVEWDKARQEALAQSDFEGTKTLHEWLNNLSPDKQELYFRVLRSGTITTEDPNGLDGKAIISGMYLDYAGSVEARGEALNEAGFRAWVDAELQPMPGFKNYTDQQKRALQASLDLWIPNLFQTEVAPTAISDKEPGGGIFSGLPGRQDKNEQELLQKVIAARDKSMTGVTNPQMVGAIQQQWQSLIDEIEQPGYLGIRRMGAIQDLIKKLSAGPSAKPGITDWERPR